MGDAEGFGNDGERAVRAIAAGNDLVILSAFRQPAEGLGARVHRALSKALQSNRLDASALAASVSRVAAVAAR